MSETLLYNSTICRLCGENNTNGELLYVEDGSSGDLGDLVNKYLPLKVKDDGKLPRTVCPGCNIQLQGTAQFFELLVEGQKKIRDFYKAEVEQQKKAKDSTNEIEIQATRIQGEDGLIYMMLSVPAGKGELMYTEDNQIALRMEGLEKPRRKRGRPPKPKVDPSEQPPVKNPKLIEEPLTLESEVQTEEEELPDGRLRRRRKIPTRYQESVAGQDLERVFREVGVIDPDEEESEEEDADADVEDVGKELNVSIVKEGSKQVIGHLETPEGHDLGELVVASKNRGRGGSSGYTRNSPRGRKKATASSICDVCGKGFPNRGQLDTHRLVHKRDYECETCHGKFSEKTALEEHQSSVSHEGILVNGKKFDKDQDEEEQKAEEIEEGLVYERSSSSELVVTCEDCSKSFVNKKYLEDHIKVAHEGLKPYNCEVCDKAFAYSNSLELHMNTSHGTGANAEKRKGRVSKTKQSKSGSCSCDICGKSFNHPSSVLYHKEAEHNQGKRYVCNKCNKSFKHKQLLQRHQLVHSDDRPYTCTTCNAGFKTKANLMNHLATHTGEKKYFCDLCGQQFAHKTSLTLHHRWHSGEKPFPCKVCGKSFSQNGNLMEHMRIHTGEKPFFCNFCGRRFTTSSQFKLHLKRHTGERPWKCEFCNKTFLHKDTWKCHVRRHRGERPYSCEFCQRGFTEQWALKKHIRIHTGEKPYSCDICGKAFSDCSNLTKHKKVHKEIGVELKDDEAEGVVWQLVEGEGEDDEEQGQHIIYVTYQNQSEEEEEEAGGEETVTEARVVAAAQETPNLQILQQLTQSNSGLVLSTSNGEEVLLSTLGRSLPMVVPSDAQIQLSETGRSTGTLQMPTSDGREMDMQVTLTLEDGQLVAHIPTNHQFLTNKEGAEGKETSSTVEQRSAGKVVSVGVPATDSENLKIQLVTEDGQAVQLITAPSSETGSFNINFDDA